jgi:hypothetical protein
MPFSPDSFDCLSLKQNQKDKEFKSIWTSQQRDPKSHGGRSDVESDLLEDCQCDLFDLDLVDDCYFNDVSRNGSKSLMRHATTGEKLEKLAIVQLDSVSISSTAATILPTVNINQSFTFPAPSRPSNDIATQTCQLVLPKTGLHVTDADRVSPFYQISKRPLSLPPEIISLTNLGKRVQADVKPPNAAIMIGDGDKSGKIFGEGRCHEKPDLEIADCIPTGAVQCVIVKPK